MNHWLLKSEPSAYGWADLVRDGGTRWDGVRNAQAAIHIRAMAPGDEALIYHSMSEKAAVGIARVAGPERGRADAMRVTGYSLARWFDRCLFISNMVTLSLLSNTFLSLASGRISRLSSGFWRLFSRI